MGLLEIIIKFQPKWILDKQKSGSAKVIDDVIGIFNKTFEPKCVFVIKKEFHYCNVIVATSGECDLSSIKGTIRTEIPCVDENTEFDLLIREVSNEELKNILHSARNNLHKENVEFVFKEFNINLVDDNNEANTEHVNEEINIEDLIAMEPMKKWVSEIQLVSEKYGETLIKSNLLKNFVYLMSINRGNGLTTVLELMTKVLKKNNLFEFRGGRPYIEWNLSYDVNPEKFTSFEGLLHLISDIDSGGNFGGIVALNIAEWLDYLYDKRFDLLLNFMWNHRDHMIFVLTIPYVEDDIINKVRARIDDVISVRTMRFLPPSDKQYFDFFVRLFDKFELKLNEDVYSAFASKLAIEKNDGRFFGFNTVKKIANEVLYKKLISAANGDIELTEEITGQYICDIYDMDDSEGVSGFEALQGLVALKEVKNRVREIISTVKLQKELYNNGNVKIRPCFHMMFSGNPGTGKTVVARLIGRIFKEEGLLPVGNFYEVSKKDLVGMFVGHTAPKTMELCRNAIGSVLFIDEAYTLADDSGSYSSEAIGTLIAEMENNRDKMVVIFAGYEDELKRLFDINQGLKDRIPYKIHFPNYSRDELKKIFYLQLKDKIRYDETFEKKVDEFFEKFPEDVLQRKDFSNGRFVRNLTERIISKSALRFEMSEKGISDFMLTAIDFEVAVSDNDYMKLFSKVKSTTKIGF